MYAIDIVKAYLKEKGFDGLFCAGSCSCTIDELVPCSDIGTNCKAGYKIECGGCDDYEYCLGDENAVCQHEE